MTWLLMLLGVLFATNVLAENILQNITYTPLSGGQVQVVMQFAGPFGEPQIFTTENPARIAIDIPATRNGMSQPSEKSSGGRKQRKKNPGSSLIVGKPENIPAATAPRK